MRPPRTRPSQVDEMVEAARQLAASLDAGQRHAASGSLDDPELRSWTYLPGDRPGLPLEHLDPAQREYVDQLLLSGHGELGAELAVGAVAVERFRRELATAKPVDGDRYWIRILGDPGSGRAWGWRINGHHLAVHVVAADGRATITPHFIGSEPAEIPHGPDAGARLLGTEEDLARELLHALDADQRSSAVFSPDPPDDILTRADPVADPSRLPAGLSHRDMTGSQQRLLCRLVRRYLDRAPTSYADRCWQEAVDTGLDNLRFAWAGGPHRGDRHYYCVAAPEFLIEYDNTQDGGNHAHSVWRHFRDDFGTDLLRHHYASGHRD